MGFKNEKQLRKLVRDCSSRKLWWIEYNLGGTDGLPDVFSVEPPEGRMVFMELKKGTLRRDGILEYEVRSAQKEVTPDLTACGAAGAIAVAQVGSNTVHVLPIDRETLSGRVDIVQLNGATLWKDVIQGAILGENVVWRCWGEEAARVLKSIGIKGERG